MNVGYDFIFRSFTVNIVLRYRFARFIYVQFFFGYTRRELRDEQLISQ